MFGLNHFDGILYINLERRKDRLLMIQRELSRLHIEKDKILRIDAIDDELNGIRGCVLSHIKALEIAKEKKWRNVVILEDDCLFLRDLKKINTYICSFLTFFKDQWDVFFWAQILGNLKKLSMKVIFKFLLPSDRTPTLSMSLI